MPESDLTNIALKLADGTPIDWDALKAEAPEAHARLLERFQQIEALAHLHADSPSQSPALLESIRDGTPLADGAPLRWGSFIILEKIGRGAYGHVYRARDPRLDRPIALKLLRADARESAAPGTAVIDEARIMARVRHPNVVTVYGAEQHDGRIGVWMEYVEGPTLEQELQEDGPFDRATIVKIGLDLCDALTAVHRAGVLHRDIKTQNVIRETGSGRIVLTDFGASLEQAGNSDTRLAGTPAYLAPEVLRGSPQSPQSDLYSLGVLLYRLATGSFPVVGKTLRDLRDAHDSKRVEEQPAIRVSPRPILSGKTLPDLRAAHDSSRIAEPLATRVSSRLLAAVILRSIAAEPSERYQSASELGNALMFVRKARRKRLPAPLMLRIAAALLAAAVLAFWWALRR